MSFLKHIHKENDVWTFWKKKKKRKKMCAIGLLRPWVGKLLTFLSALNETLV